MANSVASEPPPNVTVSVRGFRAPEHVHGTPAEKSAGVSCVRGAEIRAGQPVAPGPLSATLAIQDDAGDSPQQVALQGFGIGVGDFAIDATTGLRETFLQHPNAKGGPRLLRI